VSKLILGKLYYFEGVYYSAEKHPTDYACVFQTLDDLKDNKELGLAGKITVKEPWLLLEHCELLKCEHKDPDTEFYQGWFLRILTGNCIGYIYLNDILYDVKLALSSVESLNNACY